MTRLQRYNEIGTAYFITTVVSNKEKIFLSASACKLLLVTIMFYKYYLDYKLYAFVIMPDHFHIIIQPEKEFDISFIMQKIKGNFSFKYNRINKRRGKLWQSKFYDEGIRNYQELLQKINYIHNNPVRAGLVNSPEDYEFSSYSYFYSNTANYLIDDPE